MGNEAYEYKNYVACSRVSLENIFYRSMIFLIIKVNKNIVYNEILENH